MCHRQTEDCVAVFLLFKRHFVSDNIRSDANTVTSCLRHSLTVFSSSINLWGGHFLYNTMKHYDKHCDVSRETFHKTPFLKMMFHVKHSIKPLF